MGKKYSVEYEGLHKICFRCGCYGHKMEYCSKNPSRVSEEPTRRSQPLNHPSGSSTTQPFDLWMLSTHVRQKNEQLQARMNKKVEPLTVNRRLNEHVDREKCIRGSQQVNSGMDGSPSFTFGLDNKNRGKQQLLACNRDIWESVSSSTGGKGSKFAVLADVQDDSGPDLELLKKQIRNIPSGPKFSGHEKAQIKLEKGLKNKKEFKNLSSKKGIVTNEISKAQQGKMKIVERVKQVVGDQVATRPCPLQTIDNSRSQGRSETSIPSVDLSKCAEELTASFTKETKVKKLKVINAPPESGGKTSEMDINHIQLSDKNVQTAETQEQPIEAFDGDAENSWR